MKYKSKNLDFLNNDMKLRDLCYYDEHYYFQCDSEIADAEIVSDAEFEEAKASIAVVKPEPPTDPVMEKLSSIEAKIQTNEDLQTFYDEIVKEVGL